ncbi:uncharacterized protein [Oryza sativa Japonica Group]|uniref:DUF7705 domain-containing protein n=3 Tax=Oryza TaxID=4527 RepID=B9FJU4_ORYSJ|nr:uncharacterized protein LOC4338267 isoform X1 [Oryza sativa Japonica Group]EAY97333.1 hypothetical protein OsI_19257 [Oryza sativa Indica Group]EEE63060.1 hypothetical protein OsJ_17868 [Oryza sativa Japonica Group]KAF2929942.1 hypothetical protein DAI22_05g093400 [Oryza sativa Japonica Group]
MAAAAAVASLLGFVLALPFCLAAPSITTHGSDGGGGSYVSAVGDPGMRRDGLHVAWEAWNFCNEVGQEAPGMGSPRGADCFDLVRAGKFAENGVDENGQPTYKVVHRVTDADNNLRAGDPLPGSPANITDVDLYAAAKELYLGDRCQVPDSPSPWQFWMVMLKNGNLDTTAAICPENGRPARPFSQTSRFPCPGGAGCMNQPLVFHNRTALDATARRLRGGLFGTYDLDAADLGSREVSYYSVTWEKDIGSGGDGGWVFHHKLRTAPKYPWLMLYLRSDATKGFSGGYHYDTRGMTKMVPESPNFKVRVTLEVKQGGGPNSQFYLMDMGSCWKNDGRPCDGDTATDVTRYSEMIINPETPSWCTRRRIEECPPWHTFRNGTRVHRTDAARFPYAAYHVYCSPGNARAAEEPTTYCDAYSNPQPQEILQLVPHPVWGEFGYPTAKGQGWIGDPRTWELDVGALSQALYFYQDPGTPPAKRRWSSLDVGTEIYVSKYAEAEWTLSGFDIVVPEECIGSSQGGPVSRCL